MYNLTKRYQEPHRKYHTLTHVFNMLRNAQLITNIDLTNEQIMAVWFHDAVYVPGSKTNEEDSVDVFNDWCFEQKAVSIDAKIVRQIILDTKEEIPTIDESKLVIDLDLMGLGTSEYWLNYYRVQDEFLAQGYSVEEFKKGRRKWLEMFIERKTIFVSGIEPFTHLEYPARKQLEVELKKNIEENS